ncbi:thioesterase II family protein [Amycolatopsis regifaucium]|nr:alpha/beta fold hydrolase [Amycolatopsis regifaucium]
MDTEVGFGYEYLCFPPAGGTVLGLRGLARASSGSEVWGAEYPGRGECLALPPAGSIEELAEEIAGEALDRFGADGLSRIVLIGFSMGAFVAFEVARRVCLRGHPAPAALVVVGVCAPHRRARGSGASEVERLIERIALTRPAEYRDYVLDLLYTDLRLTRAYAATADAPLTCPILAVRGEDDLAFAGGDDALRAWRAWTSGRFECRVVPGGHLGVLTPGREAGFWTLVHEATARQGVMR